MGAVFGIISEQTPAHLVVAKTQNYHVWRYTTPSVIAVVRAADLPQSDVPLAPDKFASTAFRILAGYIGVFGTAQNVAASSDAAQSLAMTAPVIMPAPQPLAMTAPVIMPAPQPLAMTAPVIRTDPDCMMFVLPTSITSVKAAPRPSNPAISIEMLPAARCDAVYTFTGLFQMQTCAQKAELLLKFLNDDGVKIVGEWSFHGYNPPFTLPWWRRNEIHVPVDPTPYAKIT